VPLALAAVRPGGAVVCGGIHMTDIPAFPYRLLWEERTLRSVANLTRRDGVEYLAASARVPLSVAVETFPLDRAGDALQRIRSGAARGSVVLRVS
jgi:propanol-preferring alcohol dehydrogenase